MRLQNSIRMPSGIKGSQAPACFCCQLCFAACLPCCFGEPFDEASLLAEPCSRRGTAWPYNDDCMPRVASTWLPGPHIYVKGWPPGLCLKVAGPDFVHCCGPGGRDATRLPSTTPHQIGPVWGPHWATSTESSTESNSGAKAQDRRPSEVSGTRIRGSPRHGSHALRGASNNDSCYLGPWGRIRLVNLAVLHLIEAKLHVYCCRPAPIQFGRFHVKNQAFCCGRHNSLAVTVKQPHAGHRTLETQHSSSSNDQ